MKPKLFATEAALCTAYLESVDKRIWTPYAETAGWDILLVRRNDGFQVGIQAKLRLNIEVINQSLDEYGHWSAKHAGPDCRALLVPGSSSFDLICKYLGLVVIFPIMGYSRDGKPKPRFQPVLPEGPAEAHRTIDWPEWAPHKRHALPAYIPDVVAGSPSPIQLTDWKIKAIKLAVLLEDRGFVFRADFAHLQLDHRRWVEGKWLVVNSGRLTKGPGWPNFKSQHPKVYKQIAADIEKWRPSQKDLL